MHVMQPLYQSLCEEEGSSPMSKKLAQNRNVGVEPSACCMPVKALRNALQLIAIDTGAPKWRNDKKMLRFKGRGQ